MLRVRNPAVAGSFYPSNASELQTMIDDLLVEAGRDNPVASAPKAIVAPHAGYIYSGPVAASAYAALGNARDIVSRVVLLGPAHRVLLRGLALPESGAFATPLGCVPVDQAAVDVLSQLQQVSVSEEAHATEHSLEVHLPFLQCVLAHFQLVPLVVGGASAGQVAELLERLWGGKETLIVISSDLSHYHDYETARRLDRATSDVIERFAYEDLNFDQACGRIPLSGLLLAARARGMTERTVDLRNSGDTAGPRDEVVGYGAYLFYE
jgi:AmmeMemoRadiSam system protein B